MIQEASLTWRYVDTESNLIMPWFVFDCLKWLKGQDIKKWVIFEYGCGYSTTWFRLNCKHIFSIDNNLEWAKAIGIDVMYENIESLYIKSIEEIPETKFDCIIVDGEWREECVEFCRPFLKSGGFLIVDNYNQEGFPSAEKIDTLLEGWTKQVFKQYNHSSWASAVFQKPMA